MICGQRLIARILMSLALAPAGAAHAQYPNKPIKWIVPYPPGGITDTVTRLVTQKIQDAVGQPRSVVRVLFAYDFGWNNSLSNLNSRCEIPAVMEPWTDSSIEPLATNLKLTYPALLPTNNHWLCAQCLEGAPKRFVVRGLTESEGPTSRVF